MFHRVPLFCRCLVVALAPLAAGQALAQLASRSPFIPPQSNAPPPPAAGAPLEFRGIMVDSDGIRFRLYDPARKTGTWVKLNERNPDFDVVVKQHDDGQNTLTIEYQGRLLTLAGRESKVSSSGTAVQPIPLPAMAPAVPAAVTQAVVINPTPADEQRRLEAVAAEVARRRALREQALQQPATPGAMPQVVVPQTPQPPQRTVQPPGSVPGYSRGGPGVQGGPSQGGRGPQQR
jgi:hypothetical protein